MSVISFLVRVSIMDKYVVPMPLALWPDAARVAEAAGSALATPGPVV